MLNLSFMIFQWSPWFHLFVPSFNPQPLKKVQKNTIGSRTQTLWLRRYLLQYLVCHLTILSRTRVLHCRLLIVCTNMKIFSLCKLTPSSYQTNLPLLLCDTQIHSLSEFWHQYIIQTLSNIKDTNLSKLDSETTQLSSSE